MHVNFYSLRNYTFFSHSEAEKVQFQRENDHFDDK